MEKKSKLVIISGATRGLGRAMALGFASAGCHVLGFGRSADLSTTSAILGPPHDIVRLDILDERSLQAWASMVLETFGPPDILLNNAALMNCPAKLWEVPAVEMDTLLRVNIGGTVTMIRLFVPAMVARGAGLIVNFSSGWGRSTSPGVGPYCATKWAVEGLTRALAQELPPGVMAAVALNPGIIDTDMLRRCWPDDAAQYIKPDEWADKAVPFILGLGPEHNGTSLTVR